MDTSIIGALITGAFTVLAVVITNTYQNRRAAEEMAVKLALIKQEIETLSDRVDKHNSVIERTYKLEQRTAVLEEKAKVANHRITDLEEDE
ncbi:MAG: hypothetical protein IJQ86_06445 [Spirochaetia bacterium]|nr:hypothetical protein [Spirochaetia bacterium]